MSFPLNVREDVLVACGRHCCLCHKFCGTKIEVHHICLESKGGDNTFNNAIPLCFDCHADMTSYDSNHPKGTKYTENEIKSHRDNWYKKVQGAGGLARSDEVVESDKKVYRMLTIILPWNGSLHFVRFNNFAGFSFQLDKLDDLYKFEHECENPFFEFIDSDLEGLRASLREHIQVFIHTIAIETFPTHNPGRNAVPEEWEYEQPDRFRHVVNLLHNTAKDACETYDALIKLATRKLGIVPENIQQGTIT